MSEQKFNPRFIPKRLYEMVEAVNENTENYQYFKDSPLFALFLQYAYDPAKKLLLPDGTPPYKADESPYPISTGNFNHVMTKLYILLREDLKPIKREQIFIEMLESINYKEAELLVAISNQHVELIFPNLSLENMYAAGIIQPAGTTEVTLNKMDGTTVVNYVASV